VFLHLLSFDVTSTTSPLLSLSFAHIAASSLLLTMYPSSPLGDFDFGASFGNFGADFGHFFEFGPAFDAGFSNFLEGLVSVGFDDASVDGSGCPHRDRHVRWPNCHYRIESVRESAWYRYFTHPGMTRELTHELSMSDRYCQFCHFFRIPLWKVEELTSLLIDSAYVPFPRLRLHQVEFRERVELCPKRLVLRRKYRSSRAS
jgi:hypothetical protein